MNTSTNLYLPWYREENKPKFPGFELENNKLVSRIILPGEINSSVSKWFSGTATRETFTEHLLNQEYPWSVVAYSLSCREMANSLLEMDEETLWYVKSAHFVHPNIDPLHSIRIMDWASSDLESPLQIDDYLYGDPDATFSRLMKPVWDTRIWVWDPDQFQKDLQAYYEEDSKWDNFYSKIEKLRDLWITCKVHISKRDQIANPDANLRLSNIWKVLAISSHRPPPTTIQDIIKDIQAA